MNPIPLRHRVRWTLVILLDIVRTDGCTKNHARETVHRSDIVAGHKSALMILCTLLNRTLELDFYAVALDIYAFGAGDRQLLFFRVSDRFSFLEFDVVNDDIFSDADQEISKLSGAYLTVQHFNFIFAEQIQTGTCIRSRRIHFQPVRSKPN